MANYSTTANVVVTVNGKQAQQMLQQCESRAEELRKKIDEAAKAGDKVTMKKLQKELNAVNRQANQLRGSAASVEEILKKLDKATPKELNKALKELKRQLNGLERGTEAWDAQMEKIRAVRKEIKELNKEMSEAAEDSTLWDKFTGWFDKYKVALAGVVASLAGFVAAGRKAVDAYAEMQQEMANVQKYTGMTDDEVRALNEAFKQMDTRTSREELNRLAQDAGRLGKQSVDDVLGFVKAADVLNVALDDLGDGATVTLSKLTGVFGDEERYGTEQALLKVGSVINELSQNCSASAPYIAEFAERLGGVGAQAKMSVTDIMAYAAVLDSNSQALEKSATALSNFIVHLYQNPAKYAKAAGLDVKEFTELLNNDANAAVVKFLEALKSAGGMEALAPLFADMQEKGSGMVSTLSTLANNIEMVKEQQLNATQAFEEGTSVINEFNVQNGTVQAELEKSKKNFHELMVELGEKLVPVMRQVISGSAMVINVIREVAKWIVSHKTEIILLVSVISTYVVATKAYIVYTKAAELATIACNKAVTLYKTVVIALRIAYYQLTGQTQKATAAMRLFNLTAKSNAFGIILTVIAMVVAAIIEFTQKINAAREAQEEAIREAEEYKKSLTDINQAAAEYSSAEITRLKSIYEEATNEAKSRDMRRKAAEKLQALYPDIFRNFSTEQIMLGQAKMAYDQLSDAIIANGRARAAAAKIQQNESQLLDLEGQVEDLTKTRDKAKKELDEGQKRYKEDMETTFSSIQTSGSYFAAVTTSRKTNLDKQQENFNAAEAALQDNIKKQQQIREANKKLAEEYKVTSQTLEEMQPDIVEPTSTYTPTVSDKEAKKREHEAEKARKAAERKAKQDFKDAMNEAKGQYADALALNKAEYAGGLKDWYEFLKKQHEIELDYYDAREKVYTDRNLQEDADYKDLLKKRADYEAEWLKKKASMEVDQAKRAQSAEEMEAYMDFYNPKGPLYKNEEALQQQLFEIRIKYLEKMQAAYNVGSEEYRNYAVQIEDALGQEKLRRQRLLTEKIEEWKGRYEYQEASQRMNLELALLEEAYKQKLLDEEEYQKARQGIRKKYSLDYLPDSARDKDSAKAESERQKNSDIDIADSLYAQGLLTKEEYEKAKYNIEKYYRTKSLEEAKQLAQKDASGMAAMLINLTESWQQLFDGSSRSAGEWAETIAQAASAAFAVMSAGMQSASELVKAELDIQTAKVEKRYEKEIQMAEGNSYRTAKLEKEKEEELARLKSEASKKQFAMQVIQAVAQTATNALAAYGSAAAVPVIGHILAPIAASMAVAAGAVQVAVIKKQQQAAESQGYAEGGFTPRGSKFQEVGVVHAGEWVASQALVNSPVTRPILEALDYAQQNNRIGSLRLEDVSRSITAPMKMAGRPSAAASQVVNVIAPDNKATEIMVASLQTTIAELNKRLNEPFYTVNSVTGDFGMKRANSRYDTLMKNKSPKKYK